MLFVTEKKLTDNRKRAKILADNCKSHHPFETLFYGFVFVCEPLKAIVFLKFPLKSGPSYAIVKEKMKFTDRHVHVLSIFVKKKKTIQLYCFDERKLQRSEEKGKNAKQSFASHVLSLLLCAIDEVGKINRFPRWD